VVTSHGDAAVRAAAVREAPDSGSPALREPDSVVATTGPYRYREGVPGKLIVAGAAALLGIEAAVVAERRGTVFHADTVVRCQAGHLFTTWWIPGVSVKAVRLGEGGPSRLVAAPAVPHRPPLEPGHTGRGLGADGDGAGAGGSPSRRPAALKPGTDSPSRPIGRSAPHRRSRLRRWRWEVAPTHPAER